MRILVCSAYFESHRGEIQIVAGKFAREFGGLGHSVSWLAATPAALPQVPTPLAGWYRCGPPMASERSLQIPQPIPALRAFRIIKREVARADVVHVHDALYLAHLISSYAGALAR